MRWSWSSMFAPVASLATTVLLASSGVNSQVTSVGSWEIYSPNSGVVAVHMALTPDNKLLLSERFHELPSDITDPATVARYNASGYYNTNPNLGNFLTDTAVFDLASKTFTMIAIDNSQTTGYAFCNGAGQMADGNILVAGGDQKWNFPFKGTQVTTDGRRDVRIYNSTTGSLTVVATMYGGSTSGRWYPSVIMLPNEDVMIMGGHKQYFTPNVAAYNNPSYEIYRASQAAPSLTNPVNVSILEATYPINMYPITYVQPIKGNLWSLAGNLTTVINVAAGTDTPSTPLPADGILGRSFPFAGTNWMNPLSPANNYQATVWICGGVNITTDPGNPVRTNWYDNCPYCDTTSRCYSTNIDDDTPTWVAEEMPLKRSTPLAVNLPDGTIVILGGAGQGHQGGNAGVPLNYNPVNQAVLFSPNYPVGNAKRWRLLATATVARQYHGTALLLTNGAIITGGADTQNYADQFANPYEMRLEIYYPPYYTMTRPSLDMSAIVTQAGYSQYIIVKYTADVGAKTRNVSLIRFPAVTHTMNLDQRHVYLQITDFGKDKVRVQMPPNNTVAPPGNYMLWAVDNTGAPVTLAATINLRAVNKGPDAQWNSSDTVAQEQTGSNSDSPGGQATSGSQSLKQGLGAVAAVVAGGVAALL